MTTMDDDANLAFCSLMYEMLQTHIYNYRAEQRKLWPRGCAVEPPFADDCLHRRMPLPKDASAEWLPPPMTASADGCLCRWLPPPIEMPMSMAVSADIAASVDGCLRRLRRWLPDGCLCGRPFHASLPPKRPGLWTKHRRRVARMRMFPRMRVGASAGVRYETLIMICDSSIETV